MIVVRWLGYDRAYDTPEPVHNLAEDVPAMVEAYLRLHAKKDKVCARC